MNEDAQLSLPDAGILDLGLPQRPDRAAMMEVLGAVQGRVVDPDGRPLANLRIACCTLDLCVTGETDSDGQYLIEGLDEGPRKMLVNDSTEKHMAIVYYQYVPEGETSRLERDVILPLRTHPRVLWDPAVGGPASFVEGQLKLTAPPNTLLYPPSTSTLAPGLFVESVLPVNLPPYPQTPWMGREDKTLAFVFNPTGVESREAIALELTGTANSTTTYEIWTLKPKYAELEKVGTTTTSSGATASGMDANIRKLTMIILVPTAP
jgi:hypothetical protein